MLEGDAGDNQFYAGNGDDTVRGGAGFDEVMGGGDDDMLYGEAGNDRLYGEHGNDRLEGGLGPDILSGGIGADTFVWSSIEDSAAASLSLIDADVTAAGNQPFTFIGSAAFSGAPGEINYFHFNGETIIEMQIDGSAEADGRIRLPGIVTPDASWFVL